MSWGFWEKKEKEEDWQQMLAQGQSSSQKEEEEEENLVWEKKLVFSLPGFMLKCCNSIN